MTASFSTAVDIFQQVTDFSIEPLANATNGDAISFLTATTSSNDFTEEDDDHALEYLQQLERVVSIVVPIFFSIVVFVGLFGNLLVSFC
jgi:hypothetical protein